MHFPSGDLLTLNTLVAIGIAIVAGISRGLTGFGSTVIMTPMFALMYGPVVAVATAMLLEVVISVDSLTRVAKVVPWRTMFPIWIAAVITVPLGTWVLLVADADVLRRSISLLVGFLAILLLSGWRYIGPQGFVPGLGVGAASGILAGSTSMGGPPVIFYLLSRSGSTKSARAALIGHVFVVSIPIVVVLLVNGALDAVAVWRAALVFPFFLVATWLGNRMFRATSEKTFRRIVAWLLLLMALATFVAG